jgi:hypothetical protein
LPKDTHNGSKRGRCREETGRERDIGGGEGEGENKTEREREQEN